MREHGGVAGGRAPGGALHAAQLVVVGERAPGVAREFTAADFWAEIWEDLSKIFENDKKNEVFVSYTHTLEREK